VRILHVNDVSSVGRILSAISGGRDSLFQPTLRKHHPVGRLGTIKFASARAIDIVRLRKAVQTSAATHVHVHYATFAHLSELAALEYSLHVHGGDVLLDRTSRATRTLVDRALKRATRVLVSTPDLLPIVQALRADAVYVPNPMPLAPMRDQTPSDLAMRLLVLSKMDYLKGWPKQLAILDLVRGLVPDIEIFFFGTGQLSEGERKQLSERVTALGGRELELMPRKTFLEFLPTFDLALGQQDVGSLGMSEMEAMACGVPVIADVSAYRLLGCDPPVITAEELASRGASVLGRKQLHDLGAQGRRFIRDVHDPAATLRKLTDLIGGSSR
jgi:glycosyltransferase involved in cell wall biosynthesis